MPHILVAAGHPIGGVTVPLLMRVALVYHCPQTTHRLDDALDAAGAAVERIHLESGEPVPGTDFDRAVILGGAMGAYDVDTHPWLEAEKEWIRTLVELDIPVLGICLGSQLVADSLGGRAFKAEISEAAVVPISLTPAGEADPVVSKTGPLVYALHQDTFDLPPGASLLAHTERFPHAFRLGSALALQFHPDADLDLGLAWGKEDGAILQAAGVEYDDYAQGLIAAEPQLDRNSRAIFTAWLAT
jgi:GMP synthase (glutamine-hydrolysing)